MSYIEYHVARRYVQFEGALRELANYASLIGRKVLILTACAPVTEQVVAKIREGIDAPAAKWMNPQLAADSPRYARYMPMTDRFDALRREMEGFAAGEKQGVKSIAHSINPFRKLHFQLRRKLTAVGNTVQLIFRRSGMFERFCKFAPLVKAACKAVVYHSH